MQVENSGATGTVHRSAAKRSVQPRRRKRAILLAAGVNPRYKEGAVSVRLFIGNLPYTATEADLREHLSSVGLPTSVVLPVDRETGRPRGFAFVDYADRAVAEEAIKRFDQQPFKGRGLAVSEARPREDRPAGAPRPGGFSPRPGGYVGTRPTGAPGGYGAPPRPGGFSSPRPAEGGGVGPRGTKNFGPDAPPKHKRKPHQNRNERGPKPIKERPVSRLYENDEDWRAKDEDEAEIDNIATHKDDEEAEVEKDKDVEE
jgi:RNA recognition motif-containing protein